MILNHQHTPALSGRALLAAVATGVELSALVKLTLQANRLAHLPESIGDLARLAELDLRSNAITQLPANITRLRSLEYLDLRANRLTALPEDLDQLLDLRWNQLTRVPNCLAVLESHGCIVYV